MKKEVRGKRASANQKEFLIDWLEENADIANDKFVTADGVKFRDSRWKELAEHLNGLGGTHKDGPKWRKYWSDLRLHTREKDSAIKRIGRRSVRNEMGRVKALTQLEERVVKLTTIKAVHRDDTPEMVFCGITNARDILNETLIEAHETVKIEAESLWDETASPTQIIPETTTASSVNLPANPIPGTSVIAGRNRIGSKRKLRLNVSEKFFKIEEKKFKTKQLANSLKREEIAAIREQTAAIRAGNEIRSCILSALHNLLHISM